MKKRNSIPWLNRILDRLPVGQDFTKKLIVLFLGASILPLCVVSIVFYTINQNTSRTKLMDAIWLTGMQISSQMEERFTQMDRVADTIEYYMLSLPRDTTATDPSSLDAYSTLRTNVQSLKTTFDFDHVCFFLEGDVLYSKEGLMFYQLNQLEKFGISLSDLKQLDENSVWYYRPKLVYPFMVSMTYRTFSEILCVRMLRSSTNDGMKYVYFVGLDVSEFHDLLAKAYRETPGITGYLTDAQGHIIASSEEPGEDALQDIELVQGTETWSDTKYYYFQSRLKEGWVYVTRVARSYIRANLMVYIYILLLIMLITIPLVSILIIYLTKNMTHRITLLSESARQANFDQNQFHAMTIDYIREIPREEYDEVDQLAEAYNRMVGMIYENIDHITELRAQEETLKRRLLQSLINPHFLYNILDSIATCNRIGKPELANKMIMNLTRFYRMTLRKSNELITIRDELEIATLYMELESICRGGNFTWEIEADDDIENFLICKFTLQPFIENSIRHGMQGLNQHLHIHIQIRYADENIIIYIQDNGHGISPDQLLELQQSLASGKVDTTKHFGICNVNARISSDLFGHGFIEIDSEYEQGTTVKIEFQQILP